MNFTEDRGVSNFNNSFNQTFESPDLVCGGATDEQFEWFEKFSYWSEVFQLGLGKISFIALWLKDIIKLHIERMFSKDIKKVIQILLSFHYAVTQRFHKIIFKLL